MKVTVGQILAVLVFFMACFSPAWATEDDLWSAIESLQEQLDMTAAALEMPAGLPQEPARGMTTIGGYGEWHFSNLDSKSEMDIHRVVLFVGHEFDDALRFFSEWDLEHADSLELEQALLTYDLGPRQRLAAGVMLMPLGIINESHEPTAFYGVERNPVETQIIPTTWREGGLALSGNSASGLGYDLMLSSGLNAVDDPLTTQDETYIIRSGRQQVAQAVANDFAATARLKWTGIAGLELSASIHRQENITQGRDADAAATMLESHVVFSHGSWTLKALYARWDINGPAAAATGRDLQHGGYLESAFRFSAKLGVFARFNVWDNRAGDSADSEQQQLNFGANYWLHEGVVVKADYMRQRRAGKQTDAGLNLAIGYAF